MKGEEKIPSRQVAETTRLASRRRADEFHFIRHDEPKAFVKCAAIFGSVNTTATVKLEMVDGAPTITTVDLNTEADVPGIDDKAFQEQAEKTKKTCPVSRALAGPKINLSAKLTSS